MAFGRSFSSWRYRSRYGTRSTRRWRSGARRRALGNARAARQQRDASTVTISRIASVPVTITTGNGSAAVVINHWNELRQSAFFPNYAPMYDQMKIEKIRAKFTGSRAGSAQTSNISPAVVLAFDRNGLSASQQVTTTTISTYSSAQLKQWSTGNAFSMYQTIYPSTIMEKGQYIPTESLVDPSDDNSSENPCSPYSDPQLPFKPVTMIGVDLGGNVAADNTFSFTVEYEYTVTFRGMRKPSIAYDDVDLRPLSVSIVSNGTYRYQPDDFDGYSEVTAIVNVPTSTPILQPGSANITSNGTATYYPSSGYDGFSNFTVTTNIPQPTIDLDIVSVSLFRVISQFPDSPQYTIPLTDFIYATQSRSLGSYTHFVYMSFTKQSGRAQFLLRYFNTTSTPVDITEGTYYYFMSSMPSSLQYNFSLNRQDLDTFQAFRALESSNNYLYIDLEDLPDTWWI